MEYRQMKYIVTIAECGSISAAAAKLFISQPALSSFVAKTEKSLGVKLFERSSNSISLTYAGERYVAAAKRILDSFDRLQKSINDIKECKTGKLRIGMPEGRLAYMVPGFLSAMKEKHPLFKFELSWGNAEHLLEKLDARELDLAVMPLWKPSNEHLCLKLFSEPLCVVAKAGYLGEEYLCFGRKDAVAPEKICDLPVLVLPNTYAINNIVGAAFNKHEMELSNIIECSSAMCKVRMASAGLGIAIVLMPSLETVKTDEEADVFLFGDPPEEVNVYAVFSKNAYVSEIEKETLETITRLFGSNIYEKLGKHI